MDEGPDTDPPVESQIQDQHGAEPDVEGVGVNEQAAPEPGPPVAPKRPASMLAGATSLQDFFRILGSVLVNYRPPVEARKEADAPSGEAARENVKQALKDLRESQTAVDQKPKHRYLGILAPAALAAVLVGVFLAVPRTPEQLPEALIGSWQSSAAKYQDRTLYLSVDEIGFGQGSRGEIVRFPITNVSSVRDAAGVLEYLVEYDNEGVTNQYSFVHQPGATTIRLKNQSRVAWTKVNTDGGGAGQ